MLQLTEHIGNQIPLIRGSLSASAWKAESSKLNIIKKEIGHYKLHKITERDVSNWLEGGHVTAQNKTVYWAPKTRNTYLSILRKLFKLAIKNKLVKASPLDNLKLLSITPKEILPFNREEIGMIMRCKEFNYHYRLLFLLGIKTGLRINELIALSWRNINFKKRTLVVERMRTVGDRKYKVPFNAQSIRTINLNNEAIKILNKLKVQTDYLKLSGIKVTWRNNFNYNSQAVYFVFYNLNSNKAFESSREYGKVFLTPVLKYLNLKHRSPKQIRNTFIVNSLVNKKERSVLLQELGYSNCEFFNKKFVGWDAEKIVREI